MEITRLRDENRSLKEELSVLRSSVRALSALQDIIQRLTPEMDVIQLVDDLLASVLAVVDAEDGSLLLLDEEKGELVFAVVRGRARQRLTGYRMPKDQGIAGWVVANKKAQIVSDVRADPRFFAGVDQSFDFHTRSLACAPLLDGERVLGVVEALNKADEREFTEVDHDLLVVVAQLAAVAIIRAEAFAEQSSPA
jgi:GAF domain-containing protein